jgi:hypothetical protein
MAFCIEDFARLEEEPEKVESGPGSLEFMTFLFATNLVAEIVIKKIEQNIDMLGSDSSILRTVD